MGHTYSNLMIHAIFNTKDRRQLIDETIRQRLYEYMAGVARKEFGRALCISGMPDHVHGLLALRTDVSAAEAMRKCKSLSSGWVHKTFASHRRFGWQSGYGAFSVSRPRACARGYYQTPYGLEEEKMQQAHQRRDGRGGSA